MIRAVIDVNIVYDVAVTDVLLGAAENGMFKPFWNRHILDTAADRIITNRGLTGSDAYLVRARMADMRDFFPESWVDDDDEYRRGGWF